MSSSFGRQLKISLFGESHGKGIGVTIDGLPSGERLDRQELIDFLKRRAPGHNLLATKRKEGDIPHIFSGVQDGITTGYPLCAFIENTSQRSNDYENLTRLPRPSHADYTAYIRYQGFADMRGSGHFSGRLTAAMCIAGGIAKQILKRRGVYVGAHYRSIYKIEDTSFDYTSINPDTLLRLEKMDFPVLNQDIKKKMQEVIAHARDNLDSVGGIIEVAAIGMPPGIGTPIFDGIENQLAKGFFGIPGVRGVEFGTGFAATRLMGSEHNDCFAYQDDKVVTKTNHAGGIVGGITNGMPIIAKVALKPTASIYKSQQTIDLETMEEKMLTIKGRHDPCIALRALPVVEAMMATVLLDALLMDMPRKE